MIKFNSIEEIKKYYNKNTNTYEFIEDGILLDVEFAFDLETDENIKARCINAYDIKALDINAYDIKAEDIKAWDINAYDINVLDINALKINALGINARDINAGDINALDINARDISALDIKALDINALDITYYAVCFAYQNIECSSIKGRRVNAKHFVLDGEIKIVEEIAKTEELENDI